MKTFLNHLQSNFCEDDGDILIRRAEFENPCLELTLSVTLDDHNPPEMWVVRCAHSFREHLAFGFADTVTLSQDSPLLIPFIENEVTLTFVENDVEPMTLPGIVQSSCRKHLGSTVTVDDYLNTFLRDYAICSSRYGQLGRFPRPVADSISASLNDLPIRVTISQEFPPVYWNGSAHVPYPKNLAVLTIGSSWIIGSGFSAMQEG